MGHVLGHKVKVKIAQSCLTLCDSMDSPWNSLGQNTGVGSLSLLQWIFLTQELSCGLLHCRQVLYQLSYQEAPIDYKNLHISLMRISCRMCTFLEFKGD